MPNDETLPPHKPNTLRTWLPRIWDWLTAYRDWTIPFGCFLLGMAFGAWLVS